MPRADAAEVAARFGHVVEVLPTADRGVYRLTARGYAGWFETESVRWVVRPKLPWADLSRLVTGVIPSPAGGGSEVPGEFVDLIAARLAELMRERAAVGLLHGYREAASETAQVRGRIDFAEHIRRPLTGTFPVVADEFTSDIALNRVPAAAARLLLNRPDLSPTIRGDLTAVAALFPPTDDGPDDFTFDARTAPYRRLIDWCRLVRSAAGPGDAIGFLVNLEHLFQCYVGTVLASSRVTPQFRLSLPAVRGPFPPVDLRPDFLTESAVWDAKWKPLRPAGPDPADVQQVLAYAAAVGVGTAGLVYPGRAFAVGEHRTPSGVRLFVAKLRLAGSPDKIARSAARFHRIVLGRSDGKG